MPFSDENHPLREMENLRRALHAAGVALWSWTVETDVFAMDHKAFQLWGIPSAREGWGFYGLHGSLGYIGDSIQIRGFSSDSQLHTLNQRFPTALKSH